MNSLAHIEGKKVVDMVGGMMFKKKLGSGKGGDIMKTIKSILKTIVFIIVCIIMYKFYLKDFIDIFLEVQCSRYSWPIGMINEIKPFPFCVSFAKKLSTEIRLYKEGKGSRSDGNLTIDPSPHKIEAPAANISAETETTTQVKDITKILNKHLQTTKQTVVTSQKITGYDKVVYPKNEKKAKNQVYVIDDVAEKVYMGEMPPLEQRCSIGKPICNPKNKKQCRCTGESYNVILPTGVMKNVLQEQIRPVYGCTPNIEQRATMNTYQLNTSKEELIKEISNEILIKADTSVEVQGKAKACSPKIESKANATTGVKIETMLSNQIDQLINQEAFVSQNIIIEDRYGMCSPPYPFRCKKLESDVVYPQKDGKCNCNALLDLNIASKWVPSVLLKCKNPEDCKCYNCCQSNQRWIKQSITIDSIAQNIAKSSAEIIMHNKLTTKIDNSVKYIQDVPARITMLSFLWNVAVLYILYHILKYVRKYLF